MNCPADAVPSASCSASSEYDNRFLCENAFDSDPDSEWVTRGEPVGSWIQSNFAIGAEYSVTRFEYSQRIYDRDNRKITLSFSDGSTQSFVLQDDVRSIQSFAVSPVQTSFVRLTVDSVYESANNGARQIIFYGGRVGRSGNFYLPASCSYPHPPTSHSHDQPSSPPTFVWNAA